MSWFIGVFGGGREEQRKVNSLVSNPTVKIEQNNFSLLAGGIPETCLSVYSADQKIGWLVSGIGISTSDMPKQLNRDLWDVVLSANECNPGKQNGHFAIVKWNKDGVELFTDQLGLKNIYVYQSNNKAYFSTRLDWIVKVMPQSTLNFSEFGSQWLMINQLSAACQVGDVFRLCQGAKGSIKRTGFTHTNYPWHPSYAAKLSATDMISALNQFSTLVLESDSKLSLGLSGGLDSRVLLAFLYSSKYTNWGVHSFKEDGHPDKLMAAKIAKDLGIECTLLKQEIPSVEESLDRLRNYVGQTHLAAPASGFLDLLFYPKLYKQGKTVIDGGSGEIARRRYLNRLLLLGKKAILNQDILELKKHLRIKRGSFVSESLTEEMDKGINNQLEELFAELPSVREFGIENWLDLFAIRTRFPNFAGPEQSRSDSELVNYMPFIQPSFLRLMFETPVSKRKNGKMFRKIIHRYAPKLKKYPLVKDNVSYPYALTNIPASIWGILKRRYGSIYKSSVATQWLDQFDTYIQDSIHSQEVKECAYYDHPKLLTFADSYYNKGEKHLAKELDWWLAFDTYRKVMER